MIKQKIKKIDVSEREGKKAINNLIELTKPIKEKEVNPIIKELEERGVFN